MGVVGVEAGIVGRDEAMLVGFYSEGLGFEVVGRFEFPVGVVCRLRRGAARLKIFVPTAPVDDVADRAAPWFQLGGWRYCALLLDALEDVDALAAAMVAAGGHEILAPSNHRPGARMAMIADPEGNAWELLAEPPDGGGGARSTVA